ncbi:MAG TPA: RNA polymerase subunit sigma-24 [Flavobacteriales bacterium]|jgi:RNA polymerase sigma-70 factor (ECF subfamily)|nr:sigma-70 family RNA polymerase sigma factor [Salibacteraceae bacterium]HAS35368.1 RNA polymerase subunit sigma-24 [Flavobacteriales bacterium]
MHNSFISDQQLVRRYLDGHESSLEVLISRHKDRIFGYIMNLTHNSALSEDVFQDTFIKVIRTLKSGRYNEEGKFVPWVLRIAHNLVIDHFRKGKRMPMSRGGDDYDVFDTIVFDEPSVEDNLFDRQVQADVKNLIEFLPDEQKEVLKMRHYSKMSFKDIAEETNVSINTALGRMRYALINLRKLIEKHNLQLLKQ